MEEGDYVYIDKCVSFCLKKRLLFSKDVYSVFPLIVRVDNHPPPDFSLSLVFPPFYLRGKERGRGREARGRGLGEREAFLL